VEVPTVRDTEPPTTTQKTTTSTFTVVTDIPIRENEDYDEETYTEAITETPDESNLDSRPRGFTPTPEPVVTTTEEEPTTVHHYDEDDEEDDEDYEDSDDYDDDEDDEDFYSRRCTKGYRVNDKEECIGK
jgi:hypothetical protein